MRSNGKGFLKGASLLALGLFLSAPVATVAQSRRERREERREDRQERREDRREERQERREERREARRGRDWNGYGNWGGSYQMRQTAIHAGYNEGVEEGRRDRSRRERFNFADESDYRNATRGYNSRYGNRALYQRYFRQGFESGYRDGYNGY